jgi:Mycothiol maleylpyruvate isomerase N-terminal domain
VAAPSREEALATLTDGQARVDQLVARLSGAQMSLPATIGGGDWSAKDLIGHLATWEALALRTIQEWQRREIPWVERDDGVFSAPATGKVDAYNARAVAEKAGQNVGEVRADAERVHSELIAAIGSIGDEEWSKTAFYPTPNGRRRKLATLVGSVLGAPQRPFGHAFAHLPDLEAYVVRVSS